MTTPILPTTRPAPSTSDLGAAHRRLLAAAAAYDWREIADGAIVIAGGEAAWRQALPRFDPGRAARLADWLEGVPARDAELAAEAARYRAMAAPPRPAPVVRTSPPPRRPAPPPVARTQPVPARPPARPTPPAPAPAPKPPVDDAAERRAYLQAVRDNWVYQA
jgi:hypothetical protein